MNQCLLVLFLLFCCGNNGFGMNGCGHDKCDRDDNCRRNDGCGDNSCRARDRDGDRDCGCMNPGRDRDNDCGCMNPGRDRDRDCDRDRDRGFRTFPSPGNTCGCEDKPV